MPGYQNISDYFVPEGTGIMQYQHMQGQMPGQGNPGGKVPPPADGGLIARPKGPPFSQTLPSQQMSATYKAPPPSHRGPGELGPRLQPRGPPAKPTKPSDTVVRSEEEYIDWLKTSV